jgi:flagellar hook-associated protein 2
MTLGGIQFGGLASGLDTGAIIDAILLAEGRTLRGVEKRKQGEQAKLTLLGTFEGLVNKLRDKARDLGAAHEFFAHKLTVEKKGIATFTLGGSAEAGAHTLEVLSLASADRYAFAGVADPEAALGTGTVAFTYGGNSYSIAVASGSDNLTDIAAAINTAAGADVTASVVNAGPSSAPSYQLVIAGDDTGADFAITGLTSSVGGLAGATHVSTASNAQVVIDGLAVQRSSNLFSDVLPGVSFTVSRVTPAATPMSFTVDLDPAGIKANIQEFVDAFNEVVEFVNAQNTFTLEDGAGGELFGDSALDAVRSTLRRALFDVDLATVMADSEGYSTLGLIGIDLQADGTLEIDDQQLEQKLNGNLDLFSDFFRHEGVLPDHSDSGVFGRIDGMLDDLLDDSTAPNGRNVDGLIDSRRVSIQRQVVGFDREIERLELRLEKLEESLVAKFAALERLLAGLQSQQAFLGASGSFGSQSR